MTHTYIYQHMSVPLRTHTHTQIYVHIHTYTYEKRAPPINFRIPVLYQNITHTYIIMHTQAIHIHTVYDVFFVNHTENLN